MAKNRIDQADLRRIAASVKDAETRSAAEIVCVVQKKSGGYFAQAALFLGSAILFAMPVTAFVADRRWIEIDPLILTFGGLSIWLAGLLLLAALPRLQLVFVPSAQRRQKASQAARAIHRAEHASNTRQDRRPHFRFASGTSCRNHR